MSSKKKGMDSAPAIGVELAKESKRRGDVNIRKFYFVV
jgi:hypothetical protein